MRSEKIVSTMTELDFILHQVDKTPFQPKSAMWVSLPELRLESEFTAANVTPDQPHSNASVFNRSFRTITTQLRKKRVSNKSKRDRIADKSVLLADRLGHNRYK